MSIQVLHSGVLVDGRRAMTLRYILWDDRDVDWDSVVAIVDGWAVARTAKREGAAMEIAGTLAG